MVLQVPSFRWCLPAPALLELEEVLMVLVVSVLTWLEIQVAAQTAVELVGPPAPLVQLVEDLAAVVVPVARARVEAHH